MNNMLKQIVDMKAAFIVNGFIYYFRRLWIIGKWMPEKLHSDYALKKVLAIIAVIFQQIGNFIAKPLYLLLFTGIPIIGFISSQPQMYGQEFALLVNMLFFLSCITGAFGDSQIFAVTRDKITIIKYMHKSARTYIINALAYHYVPFFLYYLIWLPIITPFLGGTRLQGFLLWIMFVSFRLMGEAFHLFFFERTGKVLSRNMIFEWILILLGLSGAYGLSYLGVHIHVSRILMNPLCIVIYGAMGFLCLYYITIGYRGYEKKLPLSIDLNYLLSSMLKVSSGSSFKEVEIKEKDVTLPENAKAGYQYLKGFSFFNALFFARHRRQLVRPIYYRLIIVLCVFIGLMVFYYMNREMAVNLSTRLPSRLGMLVFLMYCMTIADKACRAMFYNCDKDMLHYAYYRRPQVILRNFKIRLLHISLYNAIVAVALCAAVAVFRMVCRVKVFSPDMLLFYLAILLLSVFFTAHHLCLYYIFQPYSESLKTKNPFFSGINMAMYVLCYMCLQIKVSGLIFTMIVLCFTVVYIAGALILVYLFAPKTFRVK